MTVSPCDAQPPPVAAAAAVDWPQVVPLVHRGIRHSVAADSEASSSAEEVTASDDHHHRHRVAVAVAGESVQQSSDCGCDGGEAVAGGRQGWQSRTGAAGL